MIDWMVCASWANLASAWGAVAIMMDALGNRAHPCIGEGCNDVLLSV